MDLTADGCRTASENRGSDFGTRTAKCRLKTSSDQNKTRKDLKIFPSRPGFFTTHKNDAEHQFRQAIVAIDALPGNQVEGISPLYHVSQVDDYPDKMAAVMQISTRMDARELIGALESVSSSISDDLDLDLVDMEGVVRNEPDCMVPWPSAREHAAVLAPWFDMDPDAKLGRDPVAFLLAMAPDAAQVGMLTDNWIIGDTL